jgi:hypothetical protein
MKTLPLIAPLCFAVLSTVASAQFSSMEDQLRYLQSPKKQLQEESGEIPYNRSSWNGRGTWMSLRLIVRLGGESELGLTDDQKLRLPFLYKENELNAEWYQKMRQNPTPEYTQAIAAIGATEIPGDPYFERATDEQKDAFREASMALTNLGLSAMQTNIEETLTLEQMLKVRKLEMQLMPAMGIPYPSMFDPLGLTDDQKKEMNKITDELKAEFDFITQEAATLKAERIVASYALLKGKSFTSRDAFNKALSDVHRQYVPSEAARKKNTALQERGKKMATTLQTRLMNVLTDEQLLKMQKIMDETPKFAKQMIAQSKAQQEAQKKSPSPQYAPGPDSWRPGDPVPKQFMEERQKRFPRGE